MKFNFAVLAIISLWLVFACTRPNQSGNVKEKTTGVLEFYENTDREIWQRPELVQSLFGDLTNKTVADIGAGSGFFTFRLAERAEKVIAIEINQEVVDKLNASIPQAVKDRVEVRLVPPDDPMLQPEEVDAILIVNTYVYFDDRVAYLKKLHVSLSEVGKVLISDFKKKQTPLGPPPEFRISLYEVEKELQEAGFRIIVSDDTSLGYQYIVLAEKIEPQQ